MARLTAEALNALKVELLALRSTLGPPGQALGKKRSNADMKYHDGVLSVLQVKQVLKEIRVLCEK